MVYSQIFLYIFPTTFTFMEFLGAAFSGIYPL